MRIAQPTHAQDAKFFNGCQGKRPNWQERREVQFLVERFCPKRKGQPLVKEPFAVWVEFSDRQVNHLCGAISYGITVRGLEDMRRAGYAPNDAPGLRPAVCEHMGRLIE